MSTDVLKENVLCGLAVVKATMACHQRNLINGKARLFSAQDVAQLTRRSADIAKANGMQVRARNNLAALALERSTFEYILGCFDARLADFVAKKSQPGRKQYESFAEVAADFMTELEKNIGAVVRGAPAPLANQRLSQHTKIMGARGSSSTTRLEP